MFEGSSALLLHQDMARTGLAIVMRYIHDLEGAKAGSSGSDAERLAVAQLVAAAFAMIADGQKNASKGRL